MAGKGGCWNTRSRASTPESSMRCQQNLSHRDIAIVFSLSKRWLRGRLRIDETRAAVDGMQSCEVKEVPI